MAVPADKANKVVTLEGLDVYNQKIRTMIETGDNQAVTGFWVNGRTVTYRTGDGAYHTLVNEGAIYDLATDEKTGLTKLYKTVGYNTDGTMTQKAITDELMRKTEVSLGDDQHTLIFSNTTEIEKEI